MHAQPIFIRDPIYFEAIPMLDGEFDRFEINNELKMQLHHAETANFYHDAMSEEE